jgi:hypothetical protein
MHADNDGMLSRCPPPRLSLGAGWEAPQCGFNTPSACASSKDVIADLSMKRLVKEAPKQGLDVQLLASLALQVGDG